MIIITSACEVKIHGRIGDGYAALVTAIGSSVVDKVNPVSCCIDEAWQPLQMTIAD